MKKGAEPTDVLSVKVSLIITDCAGSARCIITRLQNTLWFIDLFVTVYLTTLLVTLHDWIIDE